jgi:lipoprotein-anchoring transpeptidase ErfK/SrfK
MESRSLRIRVVVPDQRLFLLAGDRILRDYPVSTARAGTGFLAGSGKTPTGRFVIGGKIGAGAARGTVFIDRLATDRIGREEDPGDLIVSRVLWLFGLDPENANTRERFIYVHGTNHEAGIGSPVSHGCIRMRSADVIELFDLVEVGTELCVVG